ncbi:hypothetical protein BHE74_00041398 [Ensete ventricosum]|nr:hypothetical protein GW17_00009557 [Ensete ventricosum]RWW52205.1 hypothetical protein BHE74_00041398 [Ensete ventricosum]RZR78787.1 hypothetical protein BHM03_00004308 [Ensete ventricosum]
MPESCTSVVQSPLRWTCARVMHLGQSEPESFTLASKHPSHASLLINARVVHLDHSGPKSYTSTNHGISLTFARRFAEDIRKLAGNTPGDHRKKTGKPAARMLEDVGLTRGGASRSPATGSGFRPGYADLRCFSELDDLASANVPRGSIAIG